jgi:hypothetical protein
VAARWPAATAGRADTGRYVPVCAYGPNRATGQSALAGCAVI